MKKVLVFALVLSLVLGSFSFAFAASFDDTEGLDCEGAVNVLTELGVVSGYPDGTYKPEGIVTRAEMAKLLIVALGMEDYVKGAYAAFPDVPGSHWATAYIAYATSLGIIEGYPDGTFKPDATVTYQEAATMIVRALGYQDQYLTGTWPASHVNMALAQGILDGIVATADGANRGDIAIMIYQALDRQMITYDSLGNAHERTDNMLSRLGAEPMNPDDNNKPLPVVITKEMVNDAVIDIDDLLGAFASVYTNKDEEVLVVKEVKSVFLTGEFTRSKDEFVLEDDTVYTLNNRAVTAIPQYNMDQLVGDVVKAVKTDAELFYNGAQKTDMVETSPAGIVYTAWKAANEDVFTIAAKISGNYISDIYSVQQWDVGTEVLWDADLAEELADDLTVDGWEFKYTNKDEIDLDSFMLVGADSLDAIPEDAVVTVYGDLNVQKDADISKLEVGTETVTGKITKVNSSASKFTIDGTAYAKSDKYSGTKLELGKEGTFYLNYQGDIAFFEADDYAGNYAVVMEAATRAAIYGSDYEYKVYLLTKDGEDTIYKFKDDVVYAAAGGGKTTGAAVVKELLEIKTNNDGKITQATISSPKTSLNGKTLSDKGILDSKLIVDDVTVFVCENAKNSEWYVGSLSELKTGEAFGDVGYYSTNSDGKVDVILLTTAGAIGGAEEFGFFTSYGEGYNADGDEIYEGKAVIAGADATYETTEMTTAAKDVVSKKDILYVMKYDGDAIDTGDTIEANVFKLASIKPDFTTDGAIVEFDSTLVNTKAVSPGALSATGDATGYTTLSGFTLSSSANAYFYKVQAKDGDRIDLGNYTSTGAIVGTGIDYQLIEGATYYRAVLNADGNAFKEIAIGSASEVRAGAFVILLQLDPDSDNWDTVIYVTKGDAADLNW